MILQGRRGAKSAEQQRAKTQRQVKLLSLSINEWPTLPSHLARIWILPVHLAALPQPSRAVHRRRGGHGIGGERSLVDPHGVADVFVVVLITAVWTTFNVTPTNPLASNTHSSDRIFSLIPRPGVPSSLTPHSFRGGPHSLTRWQRRCPSPRQSSLRQTARSWACIRRKTWVESSSLDFNCYGFYGKYYTVYRLYRYRIRREIG